MEEIILNRLQQLITHIKGLSDSADELNKLSVLSDSDYKKAQVICQKLESFISKFSSELNNYFRLSIDPSADDVSRFTTIQLQAEEVQIELSLKLKEGNPTVNNNQKLSSKLPKLDLPTFDGNLLRWQEFWDQYKSNIHERNLPDVDKLLYLKASLQGSAKKVIEGLESTNKNYHIAVQALRERYGKESQVIDAHYSALTKISPADTSNEECRRVLSEIERHLRVLSSLGENISHNHLRFLILEKFPEELVYELKTKIKSDSIDEIRAELERTISAREEASRLIQDRNPMKSNKYTVESLHIRNGNSSTIQRHRQTLGQRKQGNTYKGLQNSNRRNATRVYNNQSFQNGIKRKLDNQSSTRPKFIPKRPKYSCKFCKQNHYTDQCTKYRTIHERKSMLKGHCFACMQKGHLIKNCTTIRPCNHCEGRHNRALCPKRIPIGGTTPISAMHINTPNRTLLQTAIVEARREEDEPHTETCRVLLDSGSQRSYITEKMAKKLKLDIEEECRLSVYTFGADHPIEYDSSLVKVHISSRTDDKLTVYANMVPLICHQIPYYHKIDGLHRKIILADDGSLGERVDILIGNDYYFSLIGTKKITIQENLHLVDSRLGWIITGQLKSETDKPELDVITYIQSNTITKFSKPDLPLDKSDMKVLWELESIGITDSPKLTREEEAIRNFNETTQFVNGRYSIQWPWKEYPPNLPSNYGMAFGRLTNLIKRSSSEFLQSYDQTLKYQLENGIIEIVPDCETNLEKGKPVHYIPHHGVQQPDKPMRIVYDASAKGKDYKSLNDCLYCGPSLVEDLTNILIRFRTHEIGLTADVEKAFLQIGIQKRDRDVTRFLWVKDIDQPVTQDNLLRLRFCRVPFGIISSPFLLNATIKHHLSKIDNLKRFVDDIYVDNLVTGTNTVEDALTLHKTSKEAFHDISMNLRSWSSNSKEFINQIPDRDDKTTVKLLGLDWHLVDDTLKLRLKDLKEVNTKREVLRNIAQVYDPCGFAVPTLLPGKLFLQDLWKEKSIKWDTILPSELTSKWNEINTSFDDITDICLPRYLAGARPEQINQLHCFTDASTKAYAAVVYLVNSSGKGFIIGKSRLVPVKDRDHLKIPRLELLGTVIGNRLLKYAEDSLRLKISQHFLWTDSQIVIDWINSDKLLTPFVTRRVSEIKENKKLVVRYVPTELNPADIGTRTGKSKSEKSYWLQGPDFLLQKETTWPTDRVKELSLLSREGLSRTEEQVNTNSNNMANKGKSIPTRQNHSQHDRALIEEIKLLQKQHFPDEYSGKVTHLSRNLGLFVDIDGLLRSEGRMKNTDWSYDMKHPILLPRHSDFTNKIIKNIHESNYHVGASHTLTLVRQQFWIPKGRAVVERILKKCPQCVKHGGGPFPLPPTPALPPERVNYSSPFTYTGLDYLGPVLVNTENGIQKRWICLYTCLAVRAIHLEVVQNMTAEETLLALRRMISTRGIPAVITSDNAQQFKLTAEVLTRPFCIQNNIRWRFIPQLAPWYGGFYERLVALVKHCMKRTLQKNLLNDSQLLTIIKEIEAVLNTRPLTFVDAEQDHILKPSDFLAMSKCLTPDVDCNDLTLQGTVTKTDLISSWKRGLKILEEFKSMFVNRYLPSLRERYKNSPKEPRVKAKLKPKIGQVVQIKGDTSNRHSWKVGRLMEVSESGRTAKVKIGNKEYTRSVGQLYPLEADEEYNELFTEDTEPFANDSISDMRQNVVNNDDDSNDDTWEMEILENTNDIESCQVEEPEMDTADDYQQGRTFDTQNESLNSNDVEKPKRAAATRALEKIREWTQNLVTLF
ncbi:uncharacterized protein [Choristoneura fumiferana]|uniref:uncharacterized protein n=1 Tax=Choristoneura fumiferana TaxID=7141 RepID=UPI003D158EA8